MKCLKRILFGFLSAVFLSSFGLSCSVSAFQVSVSDFDTVYTSVDVPYCNYKVSRSGAEAWSGYSYNASPNIYAPNNSITGYDKITGFSCRSGNNNDVAVKAGDIVTVIIRVVDKWPISGGASSSVYSNQNSYSHFTYIKDVVSGTDENNIIDFEQVGETINRDRRVLYYRLTSQVIKDTSNPYFGIELRRSDAYSSQANDDFYTFMQVMNYDVYRPIAPLDYTDYLEDILAAIYRINFSVRLDDLKEQEEATTDAVNNPEWVQDEKDALDDNTQEAEDNSSDAQDDIDSATSSLFDIIRNFISALTSVSPGSCTVNLDAGHMTLGNVNLCQLSPPSGITALLSVVAIFFFVPLAWSTIQQIINMFRSFTQ